MPDEPTSPEPRVIEPRVIARFYLPMGATTWANAVLALTKEFPKSKVKTEGEEGRIVTILSH